MQPLLSKKGKSAFPTQAWIAFSHSLAELAWNVTPFALARSSLILDWPAFSGISEKNFLSPPSLLFSYHILVLVLVPRIVSEKRGPGSKVLSTAESLDR